jgi:hypothetical protein
MNLHMTYTVCRLKMTTFECNFCDYQNGSGTRNTHSAKLVELKSGETYNGTLISCDPWMNILLEKVVCTSKVSSSRANVCAKHAHFAGRREILADY